MPKPRTRLMTPLLFALLFLLCCQGRTQLTSPVVRVDLRHKLPARLQQLISETGDDGAYPCQVEVKLDDGGAGQALAVIWKVMADGPDRYITAVAVEPRGETYGAGNPTASAAVGTLSKETVGKGLVQEVSLTLNWQATKGCDKVSAKQVVKLRSDHKSCKPPKTPEGLLKPVE
jgi:hypothetical protein